MSGDMQRSDRDTHFSPLATKIPLILLFFVEKYTFSRTTNRARGSLPSVGRTCDGFSLFAGRDGVGGETVRSGKYIRASSRSSVKLDRSGFD